MNSVVPAPLGPILELAKRESLANLVKQPSWKFPGGFRNVVTVPMQEELHACIRLLNVSGVSSVCVLDGTNFCGFVSMFDIVCFLADKTTSEELTNTGYHATVHDLFTSDKTKAAIMATKHSLNEQSSVADALALFAEGVRRIAVTKVCDVNQAQDRPYSNECALLAVVSQRDFASWLKRSVAGSSNRELLRLLRQPLSAVAEKSWLDRSVVSVRRDARVTEALQVFDNQHVEAIAVLADDGRLIGNLSAADFRSLAAHLSLPTIASMIDVSVQQFLQRAKGELAFKLIAADKGLNTPLLDLVEEMTNPERPVHRVWLVDAAMKPTAPPFTPSDLCRLCLHLRAV